MANKRIFLVLLVLTMTFALTVLSCNNVDKELNGTWEPVGGDSLNSKMVYKDGIFELSRNGISFLRGTYTAKDNISIRKITHYGKYIFDDIDSDWYTRDDLLKFFKVDEFELDSFLSSWTIASPVSYSLNGDTLTTSWDGGQSTSIRISRNTSLTNTAVNNRTTGSSRTTAGQQALVGRWIEKNRGWEMDLLSDGTGIADYQSVTWKIEGNRLYIIAVSPRGDIFGDNGSYEYRLSGSELTLIYSGGNETYVKR